MQGVTRGVIVVTFFTVAAVLCTAVSVNADSPVIDSFDTYNSIGWADLAPGSYVAAIPETDPSQCAKGTCVKMRTDSAFGMYLDQGHPVPNGGFSIFYRAKNINAGAFAVGLYQGPGLSAPYYFSTLSASGPGTYGLPQDDTFHRLRFAWTQGTTTPDLLTRWAIDDDAFSPWLDSGTTTFTPRTIAFLDNRMPQESVWLDEISADISRAPLPTTSPQTLGYSCFDLPWISWESHESIVDGQYYQLPTNNCRYRSSTITGLRGYALFRGTIGSSTLLIAHHPGSDPDTTFEGDVGAIQTAGVQPGEDMFLAIYGMRGYPWDDATRWLGFFTSYAYGPLSQNYGFLRFKYGSAPTPASCTPGVDQNCYDNVMFLPGIEGSELSEDNMNEQVWLPQSDAQAGLLSMTPAGSSTDPSITTTGAIDVASWGEGTFSVYGKLMDDMQQWQTDYGITATTTPYDWRLSFDDLVNKGKRLPNGHISYLMSPDSGHDPYLIETLKQLAASSRTGKVTIIAHSMGGLVTKKMMLTLGDADTAKYIDKVILVATPQLGTPQAIAGLLHGNGVGIPNYSLGALLRNSSFSVLSPEKARELVQNMPSSYELLPSRQYFSRPDFNSVNDPVISFSGGMIPSWQAAYSDPSDLLRRSIRSVPYMRTFMTDSSRPAPTMADLTTPQIVNPVLFDEAEADHDNLDAWKPPAGVQLFTVAGWGNETLANITYGPEYVCTKVESGQCRAYAVSTTTIAVNLNKVIDGDGTVLEPSALWADGAMSTRYWVDLYKYNYFMRTYVPIVGKQISTDHAFIFDMSQVRSLLVNIVKDGANAQLPSDYIATTQPDYSGTTPHLHFTLHSPLTLGFVDSSGSYTGSTATTTRFDIPGVDYDRIGDTQWLSVPADLAGHVVMHGTGTGSFTLGVEEQTGDTVTATTSFAAIPVGTHTVATLAVTPSVSPAARGQLVVDYAGDGAHATTYNAQEGSVVLPDITSPTTRATTTGVKGANGWYISNVVVTLTATDTESGVATIKYSLDGTTWAATSSNPVALTISKEGTTTLVYYSIDAAGNQEASSTLTIKIDKTPPEAMIGFNTAAKQIRTTGNDNLSTTTVSATSKSIVITDEAGHALVFVVSQSSTQSNYASLILPSFTYDAASATRATTSLRYFWTTDKTGAYSLFISAIKTPSDRLVSLYIPATNKTYILQSLSSDDTDDLSKMTVQLLLRKILKQVGGMVVPYVVTNGGNAKTVY